jgi:hypothetical protein
VAQPHSSASGLAAVYYLGHGRYRYGSMRAGCGAPAGADREATRPPPRIGTGLLILIAGDAPNDQAYSRLA